MGRVREIAWRRRAGTVPQQGGHSPRTRRRALWLLWLASPGAAGWVSAISSVIAIWTTVFISYESSREDRQTADLAMQSHLMEVRSSLNMLLYVCASRRPEMLHLAIEALDAAREMGQFAIGAKTGRPEVAANFAGRYSTAFAQGLASELKAQKSPPPEKWDDCAVEIAYLYVVTEDTLNKYGVILWEMPVGRVGLIDMDDEAYKRLEEAIDQAHQEADADADREDRIREFVESRTRKSATK